MWHTHRYINRYLCFNDIIKYIYIYMCIHLYSRTVNYLTKSLYFRKYLKYLTCFPIRNQNNSDNILNSSFSKVFHYFHLFIYFLMKIWIWRIDFSLHAIYFHLLSLSPPPSTLTIIRFDHFTRQHPIYHFV